MAAAESVLGDTLQRIKNDGLIGLFEGSCTARQSPPMVIEVRSRVGVEGDALGYMGIYLREKREVCGRPMWRHFKQPDHCLAFDGSSWNAQPESMLGEPFGLLRLCDKKALTPDSSVKLGDWEVRSPAGHYMLHSSILCYVVSQDSVPREYVRPASRVLGEHYSPGASSVRGPESGTTRGGGSPKLQPGISGGERLQPPSLPPPTAEYVSRAAGMGAPGRDDICEGVGTRTAARDPRDELRRTEADIAKARREIEQARQDTMTANIESEIIRRQAEDLRRQTNQIRSAPPPPSLPPPRMDFLHKVGAGDSGPVS
uniref:Uncharacterized protein n=1 Tax=Haptolina ericina TaxID=156174 RepID=A0A7S3F018_9EUKA